MNIDPVVARIVCGTLLAASLLCGGQPGRAQSGAEQVPALSPAEKEAERQVRLKRAADGLEKLYKIQPEAREVVEKAVLHLQASWGGTVYSVDAQLK